MARVPLQTAPGVQVEQGSEVQYGATSIEPMKDVVSDDITRFGKAQQGFGQAVRKLDDELNDAEAKKLSNDYYAEVEATKNEYTALKGANAVGTVKVGEENITVFEQYQRKLKGIYESYEEKASNGTVKYIFGNKASVYTKAGLNDMTAHSIKEQRSYLISETTQEADNHLNAATTHFATWNDPNGLFMQNYLAGLTKIQELAKLNGWNLDPEAEDADGNKIGISKQYLAKVEEYDMKVLKAVYKKLDDKNDHRGAEDFLNWLNPNGQSRAINQIQKQNKEAGIKHSDSKCVNSILATNGNQNTGNFLDQQSAILCLGSSQAFENGNGGSVIDNVNSNEVDTTDRTQSDNTDTLDKMRSTSIFFSSESKLNGTLIPQHQTTHLFAIARLGVKQADSLYTKAKSSVEYDKQKFKDDSEYATEINKKIIGKYNELILEASEAKYGNKEIASLKKQLQEVRNSTGTGRSFQKRKTEKITKLEAALVKAEADDPKYVEQIENDLNIITNNIDYDYSGESTVEVDEVTGLQPLAVLKANLKKTITDPKRLATATKDLEIKYNKLKAEREAAYNQALEKAQEIAFAEGNGWENLAANGIDINDFTEADQEILKNGPPEESNPDTEIKLINNPAEARDNLNAHRPKLTATTYLKLKEYAASLNNEDNYVEATGNATLLKATLTKNNLGHLWQSDKKNDKKKYVLINNAWIAEINARQITKGNVKLTYGEKLAALNFVLLGDKVNVDNDPGILNWWGGDNKNVNYHLVDKDRLEDVVVDITPTTGPYKGKKERVFISKIEPNVLILIKASLRSAGKTVSQENIADYYLRKGRPKNEAEARAYKEEE